MNFLCLCTWFCHSHEFTGSAKLHLEKQTSKTLCSVSSDSAWVYPYVQVIKRILLCVQPLGRFLPARSHIIHDYVSQAHNDALAGNYAKAKRESRTVWVLVSVAVLIDALVVVIVLVVKTTWQNSEQWKYMSEIISFIFVSKFLNAIMSTCTYYVCAFLQSTVHYAVCYLQGVGIVMLHCFILALVLNLWHKWHHRLAADECPRLCWFWPKWDCHPCAAFASVVHQMLSSHNELHTEKNIFKPSESKTVSVLKT